MALDFVNAVPANADALLRRVSAHMTDAMLEVVAAADYRMDYDAHLAAIRAIRDSGVVAPLVTWIPHEVLQLISHSDPEDRSWKPGDHGPDGHIIRAFASAALVRSQCDRLIAHVNEDDIGYKLGGLVHSILAVNDRFGVGTDRDMFAFLTWAIQGLDPIEEELAFIGVALLIFALRMPVPDDTIVSICEWTWAEEARHAAVQDRYIHRRRRWLLEGSTFKPERYWPQFGTLLLQTDAGRRSSAAQNWVRRTGAALENGSMTSP